MSQARSAAKAHLDAGRFQEAADLLLPVWASSAREVGDSLYLTKALRRLDRSKEALEVARAGAEMLKRGEGPGFGDPRRFKTILYGLAAWCVYDLRIKSTNAPAALLDGARIIRRTLEAAGSDLHDGRSPYIRSALKAAGALNGAHRFDATWELLHILTPARLNPEHPTLGNGRSSYSDRERWFLAMCKAEEGRGSFESALRLCEGGLQGIGDWLSPDAAYFLEYRRAAALLATGATREATASLTLLAAKKHEWWVYVALGRARDLSGDSIGALREGLLGILGSDLSKMTGPAVLSVGEWAHRAGDGTTASAARQFVETLWASEGWSMNSEMKMRVDSLPSSTGAAPPDPRSATRALRAAMWRLLDQIDPLLEGRVARIAGDGRAMFIRSPGKLDAYARMDRNARYQVGDIVLFRLTPSFDKKKQQLGAEAIHVRRSPMHDGRPRDFHP